MLISPPFLPARVANQTEDAWIDSVMTGDAPGDGGYPVSHNLGWHGGLHLTAPTGQSVRAIADGTVVYARAPSALSNDPNHALNYRGAWTSDGVVVIRHDTEIGANAQGQATQVRFFSICMHLHTINPTIRTGRPIWRKDEIGQAGYVVGVPNRIHFEIVCDDDNLQHLIHRTQGELNTTADGRTDAVFGEMYCCLPVGTAVFAVQPAANVTQPNAAPAHTTTEAFFVGLRYAGGDGAAGSRGDAYVSTHRADGSTLGAALQEGDAEYNLYSAANGIVQSYRDANAAAATAARNAGSPAPSAMAVPAPSAVYDLLRFGRVIGPDALNPADVPHWRQLRYPGGRGWVNLNAANVHKFSDADFPHWKNWRLIDDGADGDSRCDSATLRAWLDTNADRRIVPAEATARLSDASIAAKLARAVCKFPTEWEAASIDARWGWLKTPTDENPNPLTDEDFARLKAHIAALCFWQQANLGIPANHWHFQPREFVRQWRRCYWLSGQELAQCIPRSCSLGTTPWATALTRGQDHRIRMSKMFGKYGAVTAIRRIHVLAQVYIETGLLRTMREGGRGARNPRLPKAQYYVAFYGRGYMQLTWAFNYDGYGAYRGFPNHAGAYSDTRITQTSTHVWSDFNPATQQPMLRQWAPRYDPDQLVTDEYSCADSGGYFWISKSFRGTSDITRVVDLGLESRFVGFISWLVNGGGNGYGDRQGFARYLVNVLGDAPRLVGIEVWGYPRLGTQLTRSFPPGNLPSTQTIRVDHARQIP